MISASPLTRLEQHASDVVVLRGGADEIVHVRNDLLQKNLQCGRDTGVYYGKEPLFAVLRRSAEEETWYLAETTRKRRGYTRIWRIQSFNGRPSVESAASKLVTVICGQFQRT